MFPVFVFAEEGGVGVSSEGWASGTSVLQTQVLEVDVNINMSMLIPELITR